MHEHCIVALFKKLLQFIKNMIVYCGHFLRAQFPRGHHEMKYRTRFGVRNLVKQGVVTLIGPVEPFATGIKMKSSDQNVILC